MRRTSIPTLPVRLFVVTLMMAVVTLQLDFARAATSCDKRATLAGLYGQDTVVSETVSVHAHHEHRQMGSRSGERPIDGSDDANMCPDCSLMCMSVAILGTPTDERTLQIGRHDRLPTSDPGSLGPGSILRPPQT